MTAVFALSRCAPAEFFVIAFILAPTMDLIHHLA
jgi:hypothetical protein